MAATENSTSPWYLHPDAFQLDIIIGEIRLVISPIGLIGLHRGDQSITLVPA